MEDDLHLIFHLRSGSSMDFLDLTPMVHLLLSGDDSFFSQIENLVPFEKKD